MATCTSLHGGVSVKPFFNEASGTLKDGRIKRQPYSRTVAALKKTAPQLAWCRVIGRTQTVANKLKSQRTLTGPTAIVGCICVTRRPYQRFHTIEAHGIVRPYPFKELTMLTLEQIQEKMKKLQVQADTLIAKKAQAAVDQIRKIMLTHGLTTDDIEAKAKAKRDAKAANGSTPNVKAKAAKSLKGGTPPKYQHPKTGATWTGHGRAPAWIAEAKDRAKFLIASGTDAVRAASVSPVKSSE
jgi:DNA-binding protein H-NS